MKLNMAVCIYADNQEAIQYPVEYIVKQLSRERDVEVWLFGGDAISTQLLGPDAVNICQKVRTPSDIATARNLVQGVVREMSSADWFVMLSADTLPTEAAFETMRELISKQIEIPTHIPTHMVELYCDVGSSPYGCTLIPRAYKGEWDADGSYFKGSAGGPDTHAPGCLHLGYLGTDAVGRHLAQHAKTWGSEKAVLRHQLYQSDRRAFVRETLLDVRERRVTAGAQPNQFISRLIFLDEPEFWSFERFVGIPAHDLTHRDNAAELSKEYLKAIDALGLREDLEFVRSVANEIGRDWSGK